MLQTKVILTSAACVGVLDAIPAAASGWEKIGIVGLLVLAVAAVWREGLRRQAKLEAIIESNTAALTDHAATHRETTEAVKELASAVIKCRKGELA